MVTERLLIPDTVLCGHLATSFNARGHIQLGRRTSTGDLLAVRIYPVDYADIDEMQKELLLLRTLRHPNIIGYEQALICGSFLCIILPLMDYCSVLQLIHTYYPFGIPEKAVSFILRSLLSALVYLHNQKLIHRGIKCSHILLNSDGQVRLTGFRHCVSVRPKEPTIISETVHFFDADLSGNLLWMAPEILRQNRYGYSLKSDMYSVGISLCEMANGFPPFADMDRLQMLYEKERGTTPRLLDVTTLPEGDDCQSEQKQRRFTKAFHDATDCCLRPSAHQRSSAVQFIDHPFVKSSRKVRKLADLLPAVRPVTATVEAVSTSALIPVPSPSIPGCSSSQWTF